MGKSRRIVKIVLWVAAAVLAAAILLVVASPFLIPRDEIRRIAIEQGERFVNREISIGRLKANVFTGLELNDISLSNMPRGQDTGFSREPMFRADKVILRYRFLPLLLRRVVVNEIEVIHPKILIERRGGRSNFSDILVERSESPGRSPPSGSISGGGPPSQNEKMGGKLIPWISSFVVRDAEIIYKSIEEDRPLRVVEVSDFNLLLSDINVYGSSPVKLSADASLKGIPSMEPIGLSIEGKASIDLPRRTVGILGLDLSLEGSEIAIEGVLRNWGSPPTVDLNVHSDRLFPPSLIRRIHLPDNLKLEGAGTMNVDVKGRPGDLSIKGFVDSTESDIAYGNLFRKGRGVVARINFDAHQRENGVSLKDLVANLGGLSLRGSGELSNFSSGPDIEAELSTIEFPLNDLLDLLPTLEGNLSLGGNIELDVKASGNARRLEKLDLNGNLSLSDVSANFLPLDLPVENLEGNAAFSGHIGRGVSGSLNIPELRGDVDGSPTILSAQVPDLRNPNIDLKFKTRELNAYKFLSLIPRREATKNSGGTSTRGNGRGEEVSPGGEINPSESAEDNAFGGVSGKAEVEVERIRFGAVELADFHLKAALDRKVATLSHISGNLYGGSLNARGKLDLSGRSPIYDLSVDLKDADANSLFSGLADLGGDVLGKFSFEMDAKGKGLSAEEAEKSLIGSGEFSLKDGHIKNLSWQNALASILGEKGLRDIEFKSFGGDLSIDKGRISSRKLELLDDEFRMRMNGTVNLNGELDYRIEAGFPVESVGLPPVLVPFLEVLEEDGWVFLPLRVTGSLEQPTLSWDMDAAEKKMREKLAEGGGDNKARERAKEVEKKVRENLERLGKDILKGIFGR